MTTLTQQELDDRRSDPRVGFKVPAHILLGSNETLHKGYVLNLSETGALVMMDTGIPVGKNVHMQFKVPPNVICETRGAVAHIMDMGIYQGIGVSFNYANDAYHNFFRNLAVAKPTDIMHFVRDMGRITVRIA